MRQRKKTKTSEEEILETLTSESREIEDGEEEFGDENKGSFFACYLLFSLSPRHKGHTYIGFTVNPRRRIRQHNGEIGSGAWRTKKKRPWEMVLCIHGFPSNVSALQFEWAWQHPNESLAVRKAAARFKSLSGVANKIKLAYTMLTLPSWQSLDLTVNFFSTKYTNHSAGCPSLPRHMKVRIRSMDELPCYVKGCESILEDKNEWDDEKWEKEASDAGNDSEETLSDHVSSQEREKSSVDGTRDDNREWSCLDEFSKSSSSSQNVEVGNHSFAEEIAKEESTDVSPVVKGGGFRSEPLMREQSSSVVITLDDEEPLQEHRRVHKVVVASDIEVIDVTTPSPLCGTSLWGKKRNVSAVFPDIIDLTRSPGFVQL